ncbi:ankyrin repeat domain-containing protein 10a isoform X1 [Brienomyrus brachyistius]|uniref:ankyrin repeat domain-containing protein 10a isoform X1 n=1 Tax=Brienomyrus brachyistius TaxID=42636 RepID=UPI0020B2059A|nr:ankyrin repeat domain-containing protein 10a isoform X1 [Brienomyrus brachyistius]
MSINVESGFSSEEVLNAHFPLHRACRDGDVGALCSLLQCTANQADLVAEDSFYGWTPIHWAAHFGKLECVMRLVQVGSGVNAVTTRFAQTPTHIAAFGGHPDCVLWLLQAGADINRQDYVGETPIHKAARAGSMECIKTLLMQGARAEKNWNMTDCKIQPASDCLRNASGLTAADLAQAQGFQECAQLLSNMQNHLNEFCPNGAPNGLRPQIQAPSLFNGAPNRKRSLDCMESNHIKKARTDGLDSPMKLFSSVEEELESMHTESSTALSSGDPLVIGLRNCHTPEKTVLTNGFSANKPCSQAHTNGGESILNNGFSTNWEATMANSVENGSAMGLSEPGPGVRGSDPQSDMCGSLHLGDSPSGCVAQRPFEQADLRDSLHFGHYHGFGDTAENIDEVSSQLEHNTSVKAEQQYKHTVLSTMHLFHGS